MNINANEFINSASMVTDQFIKNVIRNIFYVRMPILKILVNIATNYKNMFAIDPNAFLSYNK